MSVMMLQYTCDGTSEGDLPSSCTQAMNKCDGAPGTGLPSSCFQVTEFRVLGLGLRV